MRRFLILFDDIPIDKASVKSGRNSSEVVTACRCVNVGLFISGDLRRDVIVSLAKGQFDDMRVVSFPGNTLKRVSPDERSISFFLLKSMNVAEKLPQNSHQILDNGIIVTRTNLTEFISGCSPERILIARRDGEIILDSVLLLDNAILIYETGTQCDFAGIEYQNLGDFRVYYTQPYPPHPERFILDVNLLSDAEE
ncbi:MAG: hypothetical protein ACFFDV_03780 [Candidatus Thorarchaeota archaeon]